MRHYSKNVYVSNGYSYFHRYYQTLDEWRCDEIHYLGRVFTIAKYDLFECRAGYDPNFPDTEFGTPKCQHPDEEKVTYKQCKAPYEWSDEDQECITWCPPDAPNIKEGVCEPDKNKLDEPNCAVKVANPIFADTGEKYQSESSDYVGGGSFPLTFSRNYKSYRLPEQIKRAQLPLDEQGQWVKYIQPAGYTSGKADFAQFYDFNTPEPPAHGYKQWRHNYQIQLVELDANEVYLERANDDRSYFSLNTTNYYVSNQLNSDIVDRLVDTNGDTIGWIYSNNKGLTYRFNSSGKLTQIENGQGLTQSLSYTDDKLTSVTDNTNRSLAFTYQGELLISITTPNGNNITFEYDSLANLTAVIYPDNTPEDDTDNPTSAYQYGDIRHPYALTGKVDSNNIQSATWTYDGAGRATSSVNAGGHRNTSIIYSLQNVEVTEASGHKRTLTFDDDVRLSAVTGDNCGQCSNSDVESYVYDHRNLLTSEFDFNGVETRYEYNARGLRTKQTEAFGTPLARVTTTEWHSELSLPTKVITPTMRTEYVYGIRGRLESMTETDLVVTTNPVLTTTYTYNTSGLLASIDGARTDVTDVTTFAYNAQLDLISITDATGNITQINSYNANGYPTSMTDANGIVTTLAYDARNRLVSQTVAGNTTTFAYDNIGQLTKVTLPSGAITNYVYNGARLLTSISDGLGNSIVYIYDNMGNVTQIDVKDPSDTLYSTQQQVYDGLNRLTSQIDGLNQATTFDYDAVGNQTSVKTPLLKETKQVYDALNRLSETTDAKNGKTTYSYDANDNLTLVKAANNAQTTYSYDGFGNLITQTSPDTGTTTFTYDVAGNQLSKTDAKNITVNYSYDALNRLTGIDYPDDNLDVTLSYDTGTNGKGRLTQISDGSGSTTYSYNALGQVSSKASIISGQSFTVGYEYNGAGQLIKITQPSGREINLTRDSHDLITGISQTVEGTTNNLLTSASYVPFGGVKSYTLVNNKVTTKTHNLNGQVANIDVNGIYQSSLTYSPDSIITGLTSTLMPTTNQNFTYDELDRLTDATGGYGTLGYSYDSVGNRVTKTIDSQSSALTYTTASNQLSSPYTHDANGNRSQDAKRTYAYGDNNRLTEVMRNSDGLTTTYLYNGLGQRVKKSNLFGETYFIYDEQGLLIAEANSTGGITKEYVYFEGQPLVMLVGE